MDEGGIHKDKPLRLEGARRKWWWQPKMPGRKKGQAVPPSDKGVKMFESAQFNVFTTGVKKWGGWAFRVPLHVLAGHGTWGHAVGREDVGVVPDAVGDHRDWGLRPVGRQPGGICEIGARHHLRPQAQAQTSAAPATGGPNRTWVPRSHIPPTPWTPSPRSWGRSSPPWT